MLFKLTAKGDVVMNPEAVKLIPSLAELRPDQILFIILAFDYEGPYHQFPEEERIRKAGRRAFEIDKFSLEEADPKLKKAIDDYRSLQYDIRREMIISYQTKIAQQRIKLYDETNAKRIIEIDNLVTHLLKRIHELQDDINHSERMEEIKGGGQLSFIEKWQMNRVVFLEDVGKKKDLEALELRKEAAKKTTTKLTETE